jgi:hypothetical protein
VFFLIEHEEAAASVAMELGHHRPIGVESVEHEGVEEASVGVVQGVDQTSPGGQFAFMTDVLGVDIAEGLFLEHRLDTQHDIEDRPRSMATTLLW